MVIIMKTIMVILMVIIMMIIMVTIMTIPMIIAMARVKTKPAARQPEAHQPQADQPKASACASRGKQAGVQRRLWPSTSPQPGAGPT